MTEFLKTPTPSPAKTDSCNPFHNRTQGRTKERENYTVQDLGISKDREWAAKDPRVGLLNTYCAGKRPRTGWSTRLSILKKTLRDATLRLCQRSQLTLPPLNRLNNPMNIHHHVENSVQYMPRPLILWPMKSSAAIKDCTYLTMECSIDIRDEMRHKLVVNWNPSLELWEFLLLNNIQIKIKLAPINFVSHKNNCISFSC